MKYRKLKAAMAMNGMNASELAKKVGIARATMSRKLSGENEFCISEVQKIVRILGLTSDDVMEIFFDNKCPADATAAEGVA